MDNVLREFPLMKTLFQTYVSEFADIYYCPYCLNNMGNKIVCCQETDFIPFKDLDLDQQKAIIEDELDQNQRS